MEKKKCCGEDIMKVGSGCDKGKCATPKSSITDEQRLEIMAKVEEVARSRKKMQHKLNVGDFFAGAMAAMQAMGDPQPPASWVLGIMCGREEMYGMGKDQK